MLLSIPYPSPSALFFVGLMRPPSVLAVLRTRKHFQNLESGPDPNTKFRMLERYFATGIWGFDHV